MKSLQTVARHAAGLAGRESRLVNHLRPYYQSFLDWSTRGRGIPWEINGETYRVNPHYRHRLGRDYDAPVARLLRERVRPGALCFNVGANVGVYVLQFARWSGPTGRVIAFEPNPGALAVLRQHVRMNQLDQRVTIVPAAIGAAEGEAVLYAAGAEGMSRLGAPSRELAHRVSPIKVRVTTLDQYCAREALKPDWLFMDIEGFEFAALAGARELIRRCGHECGIIVEMHPNVWDTAGITRAEAEELLAELNLKPFALMGQSDPLGEYGLVSLVQQ